VFFYAEGSAPWTVLEPASCMLAPHVAPAAGHVIVYHLVTSGRAWTQLVDEGPRMELEPGDIVVLPSGAPHLLGNGPPGPPVNVAWRMDTILSRGLSLHRFGAGGEKTRLVCGYMACDPRVCDILLNGLPPLLKVNIRGDASGVWLENSIRYLVEHLYSSGAGAEAVLAKLSEVLFAEVLRRYVAGMPEEVTGWLAGARDPEVGRALGILHSEHARPWTIAALAARVGVSRAVLAGRFAHYLGESPMAYLTRWRLRLGAHLLNTTSESVAEVAARAGYHSEAAFNRAFKREFGLPPAQFRKQGRSGGRAAAAAATRSGSSPHDSGA